MGKPLKMRCPSILTKKEAMIYTGSNGEYLELNELKQTDAIASGHDLANTLLFVWIRGEDAVMTYEGTDMVLRENTIVCLSFFHTLAFKRLGSARIVRFNPEFYCVLNHDSEVSCKGILFYGANQLPVFRVSDESLAKFELLWDVFSAEMASADDLQLEMLQMLLKRFIILATRVYKSQNHFLELDNTDVELVREFNFLVEQHFKTKHTVKEYADLLNKSPKTLSNIFSNLAGKTPLQIIHDRKHVEARRLLRYTSKTVSEIAYEVGFEDVQTFSRFFKKQEGSSPTEFKNRVMGNIANYSGISS